MVCCRHSTRHRWPEPRLVPPGLVNPPGHRLRLRCVPQQAIRPLRRPCRRRGSSGGILSPGRPRCRSTTSEVLTLPLYFSVPRLAQSFEQPSTVIVGCSRAKRRSPSSPARKSGRHKVTVCCGRRASSTRRTACRATVPSGISSPLQEMMPTFENASAMTVPSNRVRLLCRLGDLGGQFFNDRPAFLAQCCCGAEVLAAMAFHHVVDPYPLGDLPAR